MTHIKNRNGTYYYRSVLPLSTRKIFGVQREICFTLSTNSMLKAKKSARIYDRYIYLITKAADMKLDGKIIDSLVDSFMQAKVDKSIKEHSLYDKKIDVDFADALNRHFKEALQDNQMPKLLEPSVEILEKDIGPIGDEDRATVTHALLEKNILSLNYLIAKLEKNANLTAKRLKFLSEQDSSRKFESKEIRSFQDDIGGLPLNRQGVKDLIDTFAHAMAVAAQKEHGLNTQLGLVKTKADERETKDIMLGKKQNIVQSIHAGKETFGAGTLGNNIVEQYKIVPLASQIPTESQNNIILRVAFDAFIQNTSKNEKWSKSTLELVNSVKNLLFKFFGEERSVSLISRDDLLKFRDILFQIPTKLNQKNKYKGKNLEQILHLGKNDSKLSEVTVQKYMIRVAQFFNYSYDSGYIGKSITNNINVKIEIDPTDRKVLPYSKEEAQTIFKIVQDFKNTNRSPSKRINANDLYYITMIAAYSGMRINEITQLRYKDIVKRNGILCFNINREEDKTTKNTNSIRVVPIHFKLLELGLIEFIDTRKNGKTIFGVNNKIFSEIFRKQIQRKRICKDKEKTFYSFRHYFIDYLVQREVKTNVITQIVGHEKQYKILLNTYAKPINPDILKAKIEMVEYDKD